MAPARPIIILQTGDIPPDIGRVHGNYDRLFTETAGLRPEQVETVHLPSGQRPAEPGDYGGILITGSSAMVTDRLPWSEFAAQWLRRAMAADVPIFGVCYGHQLLAHALGGEVAYHPDGMEVGTQAIELLPAASRVPLLASLPRRFTANVIHSQVVVTPPAGAVALARSTRDPHQILQYRDNVLTVQFHPEFTGGIMRNFLESMADRLPKRRPELAHMIRLVSDTPHSRSLMARFIEFCRP